MTDDEMIVELRREAEYLRTRTGHHQRPVMAEVHDQIADRLHALSADASLGALVRRIREHPMVDRFYFCAFRDQISVVDSGALDEVSLTRCLSLLDLWRQVPAFSTGPSGWTYERMTGGDGKPWAVIRDDVGDKVAEVPSENDIHVPPIDRPTVAKLMEASRAH